LFKNYLKINCTFFQKSEETEICTSLRETFWCIPHGNGLIFSSFFNFLKTIQKNETPNKKKKKRKKEKKKHVDIPDIPNFLLDIPYGIMTSCVSVTKPSPDRFSFLALPTF
jgi:hypothetical protein